MSTLLDQAEALTAKTKRLQEAEKSRHAIELWRPLQEALPEHRRKLDALVESFRAMQSQKLLPAGFKATIQHAIPITPLSELYEMLLNQPDKVMQRNKWGKTQTAIAGAESLLARTLSDIWKAHLARIAPNLDDWLPFFQVDRFGPLVQQIKSLRQELRGLEFSLPTSEESIVAANEKGARIRRLVEQLDFGDIPAEVTTFVKRALDVSPGATLADLTPEVMDWLKAKKLAGGFRISLGGR